METKNNALCLPQAVTAALQSKRDILKMIADQDAILERAAAVQSAHKEAADAVAEAESRLIAEKGAVFAGKSKGEGLKGLEAGLAKAQADLEKVGKDKDAADAAAEDATAAMLRAESELARVEKALRDAVRQYSVSELIPTAQQKAKGALSDAIKVLAEVIAAASLRDRLIGRANVDAAEARDALGYFEKFVPNRPALVALWGELDSAAKSEESALLDWLESAGVDISFEMPRDTYRPAPGYAGPVATQTWPEAPGRREPGTVTITKIPTGA